MTKIGKPIKSLDTLLKQKVVYFKKEKKIINVEFITRWPTIHVYDKLNSKQFHFVK